MGEDGSVTYGPATGHVADGYISGATVFADANHNGVLDAGEVSTTTSTTGAFTLTGGSGPLVAIGGTDVSTGLPLTLPLSAPAGSTVVTPLTTLVQALGGTADAAAHVAAAFGVDSSVDLTHTDPVAAGGNLYLAGVQVANTVNALSAALAGQSVSADAAQGAILHQLADDISSGAQGAALDLTSAAVITGVLNSAASELGVHIDPHAASAVGQAAAASSGELSAGTPAVQALTVSHDVSSPSSQVFALYEGLLGHAPDTAGGQSWVAALDAGTSLHDVTQAILSSPEAQAHINAGDNAGFVDQLYETVLGHAADPASAHSWVAALDAGTTPRADVADAFVFSDEHVAQLQPALDAGVPVTDPGLASAERLYEGLLNRAPDATGLQNISDALAHGGTLQDVAQNILTSAEYTSAHPQMSDGQYVEALYENLLGRTGDAASAQSWTTALANGTDRASVANAFLDSAEFQSHYAGQSSAAYVETLYEHVLGHTGDAAMVQSLASQLDAHSLSRIDVANSFTSSVEFQNHYPGTGDAGFIESLYQDALGRAPDAAGEQSWVYALSHGTSRADVALQIVDSPEAQQHLAAQVGAGLHVA